MRLAAEPFFWTRLGYTRIVKATDSGPYVTEDRQGIVSAYGKTPLPSEIWLVAQHRRRTWRWIGGDYSTR